jgi:hypothetical protein
MEWDRMIQMKDILNKTSIIRVDEYIIINFIVEI